MDSPMHRGVISVDLNGRKFGVSTLVVGEKFAQEVPDVGAFRELAAGLRQRSALLGITTASEVLIKDEIYDAYARDLTLLKSAIADCDECVRAAVRASVITGGDKRTAEERAVKTWEFLQGAIPPVGATQLIRLSHIRAAKPAPELLDALKEDFGFAVERVMKHLAGWLQVLVEEELVGLVEWTADLDVCRYHFFRHEVTERVLGRERREEHVFDPAKRLGERNERRVVEERRILREQFRERHVHHIVRAKLHRLGEYPEPVPAHVAEFLDAVPDLFRQHLHIVDGTITMEEVLRRRIGASEEVEVEVIETYKYSPGVIFGPFNLIGWSADDLRGKIVLYRDQREARAVGRAAERKELALQLKGVTGHLFRA